MSLIYFNPWSTEYKQPFGAILQDETSSFSIRVEGLNVKSVQLVVQKEGLNDRFIPMYRNQENRYQTTLKLDQGHGIYYYYFEIIYLDEAENLITSYYSATTPGEAGRQIFERQQVFAYQLTCYQQAETAPTWYREANFYQIFPDRFANGNPNQLVNHPKPNSFIYGTQHDEPMYLKDATGDILRWDFFGGNLKGIQDKIPYLKKLGVNALYLNPIFLARSNHRYDTQDYLEIDPVLGSEQDFQDLVTALHQNDMHLILDGVFAHVGKNSRYFNYDGSYGDHEGAFQNPNSIYYPWFEFTDYPNEYESWWGIKDLPKIDKHNPAFQQFIYGQHGVLTKWNQLAVDGWRLDVADELPDEFIAGVRANLDHFPDKILLGEVWEDASNKISYHQRRKYILGGHLHGVMNYPFRDAILALLTGYKTPRQIAAELTQLQENYPKDVLYNNLNNIGTHDTERILTLLNGDKRHLSAAFGLMNFLPGIPCVYYGDEAGLTGGKDPDNRKFFPWQAIDQDCFAECSKWLHYRNQSELLKHGDCLFTFSEHLFGVLRFDDEYFELLLVNPLNETIYLDQENFRKFCDLAVDDEKVATYFSQYAVNGKGSLILSGTLASLQ
ncbi:MAG: glycoside hydrolase family 13 protein [Enterococcus sp.]